MSVADERPETRTATGLIIEPCRGRLKTQAHRRETERVVAAELPNFLELRVESAEPGVRGDTANNVTKPATLETGTVVNVPLFVNPGDKIRIDTRTGKYVERVKE